MEILHTGREGDSAYAHDHMAFGTKMAQKSLIGDQANDYRGALEPSIFIPGLSMPFVEYYFPDP